MAEEKAYSKYDIYLTPEMKQNIKDAIRECAVVRTNGINIEESDAEYISVSLLEGLMETFCNKFSSEVEGLTAFILRSLKDKYKSMFNAFKASRENCVKQENDIESHTGNNDNTEINNIISKGGDPVFIAKYLTSVMEKFVTEETRKCVLLSKAESNCDGPDAEFVPISILEVAMEMVIAKFSFETSVSMVEIIRDQEDELKAIFVDFETSIEFFDVETRDLIKQLDNIKKSKIQETNLKDAVMDVNIYKGVDFKDSDVCIFDGKKKCSIICRFANRKKKYEIIAARKQAKGKKCDPLPIPEVIR